MQPQPYSLVGDGAGSIFKIFTTAAAMEKGLGTNAMLDVPRRFEVKGIGSGGATGCPAATYCVENAGNYPATLSVTDALAQSPNTAFVKLIESTGVTPTVDMAVRLGTALVRRSRFVGLRRSEHGRLPEGHRTSARSPSAPPGSTRSSSPTSPPPSPRTASGARPRPIDSIFDRDGKPVPITEQALRAGSRARPGGHSRERDEQGRPGGGTSAVRGSVGLEPADVRQDRHHRDPQVVGVPRLHQQPRAAVYIYGDSPTPGEICSSPLAPVLLRQPVRRYRTGPNLVRGDDTDRHELRSDVRFRRSIRSTHGIAERSGSRRHRTEPVRRDVPAAGVRFHGERGGHVGQRRTARNRHRRVAVGFGGSRFDHHDLHQ